VPSSHSKTGRGMISSFKTLEKGEDFPARVRLFAFAAIAVQWLVHVLSFFQLVDKHTPPMAAMDQSRVREILLHSTGLGRSIVSTSGSCSNGHISALAVTAAIQRQTVDIWMFDWSPGGKQLALSRRASNAMS
jgi:hypothetical protein